MKVCFFAGLQGALFPGWSFLRVPLLPHCISFSREYPPGQNVSFFSIQIDETNQLKMICRISPWGPEFSILLLLL